MQFRYEMSELNEMLRPDCETLARELLADVKRRGNQLIGYLPNGGKVSMALAGAKRGLWKNWHAPDKTQCGGPINLVQWALFNGDRNKACIWTRARLRLDATEQETEEERQRRGRQRAWQERKRTYQAAREADQRVRIALDLYQSGRGDADEVHDYLAGRFGFDVLPYRLRHLRFVPRLTTRVIPTAHAAMLAPIVSLATARQVGVHVTLLEYRTGRWRKAKVPDAKRMLGLPRDAVIPLLAGERDTVMLAEGIENALAAAWLTKGSSRVWAAGSASFVATLALPDEVGSVIAVRDNDAPDSQVAQAWRETEAGWRREGRTVETLRVPDTAKDFAAYLEMESCHG